MTWEELRNKINLMTEEEQQQQVAVWGEDFSLRSDRCILAKTEKSVYYNHEWDESCEEDDLLPEDLADPGTYKICEKGMYYILG